MINKDHFKKLYLNLTDPGNDKIESLNNLFNSFINNFKKECFSPKPKLKILSSLNRICNILYHNNKCFLVFDYHIIEIMCDLNNNSLYNKNFFNSYIYAHKLLAEQFQILGNGLKSYSFAEIFLHGMENYFNISERVDDIVLGTQYSFMILHELTHLVFSSLNDKVKLNEIDEKRQDLIYCFNNGFFSEDFDLIKSIPDPDNNVKKLNFNKIAIDIINKDHFIEECICDSLAINIILSSLQTLDLQYKLDTVKYFKSSGNYTNDLQQHFYKYDIPSELIKACHLCLLNQKYFSLIELLALKYENISRLNFKTYHIDIILRLQSFRRKVLSLYDNLYDRNTRILNDKLVEITKDYFLVHFLALSTITRNIKHFPSEVNSFFKQTISIVDNYNLLSSAFKILDMPNQIKKNLRNKDFKDIRESFPKIHSTKLVDWIERDFLKELKNKGNILGHLI